METSTKNYSTYFLGTPENVANCTKIFLINDTTIGITIYNLSEVYQSIKSSGTSITRDSDNKFISSGETFNVIIYLLSDEPVGFTKFLSTQGNGLVTNIILDIEITEDTTNEVSITYSTSLEIENKYLSFIGDENYKYSITSDIQKQISSITSEFTKYTNNVRDIILHKSSVNILNKSTCLEQTKICRLKLIDDIDLSKHYSSIQVGFYEGDLVLYSWENLNYTITSLTTVDRFGNPEVYAYDVNGEYSSIDPSLGESESIVGFKGKYAVLSDGNYYDTYNKTVSSLDNTFIDYSDIQCQLREVTPGTSYESLLQELPDLVNVQFDFGTYYNRDMKILSKHGNWYTISDGDYLIYTCLSRTVIIMNTDTAPKIINNELLLLEPVEGVYTIFTGTGEYDATPNNSYLGVAISDEELISIVVGDSIVDSEILRFRHSDLPESLTIPSIISTFKGLLFYTEDNYLKYL